MTAPDAVVVSVDPETRALGASVPLLDAHTMPGTCHLAISVQLIDAEGRWLLARRALTKRTFAGLWSNTCCTHPRPGEDVTAAARRRLTEELGIATDEMLEVVGTFVYRAQDLSSGLVEHEWDHVVVGRLSSFALALDPAEVHEVGLVAGTELPSWMRARSCTPWFADVVRLVQES